MKSKNTLKFASVLALAAGFAACSSPENETQNEAVEPEVITEPVVEEEAIPEFEKMNTTENHRLVIYEDGITHQPPAKPEDTRSDEEKAQDSEFMQLHNERFLPQEGDVSGFMGTRGFETMETETLVAVIPLDDTQTITAYNKKDKFEGEVQIVSRSSNGEIDHIVFKGKHHTDNYNVSAGLTGHQARKLRRNLKHMYHKGQVFLYEENSNILYLMDSKNLTTGEEVTMAEVDEMTVHAIVWKDAKHQDDNHDHDHGDHEGHDH